MLLREHLEAWFKSRGFVIEGGIAIADSGYGSGGIILDLTELENELAEAVPQWMPIATLPPPGERPGKIWVLVEGSQEHSGMRWRRRMAGLARTHNDGFDADDILRIEKQDNMDRLTGEVTHWLPIVLPRYPD